MTVSRIVKSIVQSVVKSTVVQDGDTNKVSLSSLIYTTSFDDLSFSETFTNRVVLDALSYSTNFRDLGFSENEVSTFTALTYTTNLPDLSFQFTKSVGLTALSYSTNFRDITFSDTLNPELPTANLVAHYIADSASITRDGSNHVTAWADDTANSYNLTTTTTPGEEPEYIAVGINGNPSIDFPVPAANRHIGRSAGAFSADQTFTIGFVLEPDDVSPENLGKFITQGDGSLPHLIGFASGAMTYFDGTTNHTLGTFSNNTLYVCVLKVDGASSKLVVNKSITYSFTSATGNTFTGIRLGGRGGTSQSYDGEMGTVVFYDDAKSDADINAISDFLNVYAGAY